MTVFAHIRARRSTWCLRTVAAFACAWLTLALQPCVMAEGMPEQHDCPHCPPQPSAHHEMPHAMPAPCGAAADCDALHDLNYDGRLPEVKLDPPAEHLVAVLPPAPDIAAPLIRWQAATLHRQRSCDGADPPRHLLLCIFLN